MYKKLLIVIAHIVLILGLIWWLGILLTKYSADIAFKDSENLLKEGRGIEALRYANKAILRNPQEANYFRNRARIYISMALATSDNPNETLTYKILALEDMKNAYNLNPNNLVTMRNLLPLYYYLSIDEELSETPNEVGDSFLHITTRFFDTLKNMAPNDIGVYLLVARYQYKLELFDAYFQTEAKIKMLRSDILDWYSII